MIPEQELKDLADKIDVDAAAIEVTQWVCRNVENFIDNHMDEFNVSFSTVGMEEEMPQLAELERLFGLLELGTKELEMELSIEEMLPDLDDDQVERLKAIVEKHYRGEYLSEKEQEAILEVVESKNLTDIQVGPHSEEIEEEAKALKILYGTCEKIKIAIEENEKLRDEIFKKMSVYYEFAGARQGNIVFKELDGYVKVSYFAYDPYDMPIEVIPKTPRVDEEGDFVLDEEGNVIVDIGEAHRVVQPASYSMDLIIDYWEKKPTMSLF